MDGCFIAFFVLLQFLFLSLLQGSSPFFRLDPLFLQLPAALLQLLLPQLPCLLLLLQPLGLFSSQIFGLLLSPLLGKLLPLL